MRSRVTSLPPENDILYLNLPRVIEDPGLRCMVDCVQDLRPFLDEQAMRHGQGTLMAALIAIVANKAIKTGDSLLIADAFRQNAQMLEVDSHVGDTV